MFEMGTFAGEEDQEASLERMRAEECGSVNQCQCCGTPIAHGAMCHSCSMRREWESEMAEDAFGYAINRRRTANFDWL